MMLSPFDFPFEVQDWGGRLWMGRVVLPRGERRRA